jgi:aryl sulfotransferase
MVGLRAGPAHQVLPRSLVSVTTAPVRYRSDEEDSARWIGFPFRPDDIVISTRSKTGTTWVQMICALLVFQTPDLPSPLSALSPWLDRLTVPRTEVYAQLEAQRHRRFIKTHTPLDGLPDDRRVTYLVTARHPLDMAVSLYHQGENLNRDRIAQLLGQPRPEATPAPRPPMHEWLRTWIEADLDPRSHLDSLPGVMWHLSDAWRRRDQSNIVLIHYDWLSADLETAMRYLADRLGIDVPDQLWPDLVRAATFESMRADAHQFVPDTSDILIDPVAFFRRGTSGGGVEILTTDELERYRDRAAELAPSDLLAWLHSEPAAKGGRLEAGSRGSYDPST